jgi:hypothetical protein
MGSQKYRAIPAPNITGTHTNQRSCSAAKTSSSVVPSRRTRLPRITRATLSARAPIALTAARCLCYTDAEF